MRSAIPAVPTTGAPRATRPPYPELPLHLTRAVAFSCIALAIGRDPLRSLVGAHPSIAALSPLQLAREPLDALPAVLRAILEPPIFPLIEVVALGALAIIFIELLWALVAGISGYYARRRAARAIQYLRIRPPQATPAPANLRPGAFQRMIHGGMAAQSENRSAPWCVFAISGAPDLAAEAGIYIAGFPGERRRIAAMLAGALASAGPEITLDEADDPLAAAWQPGRWVARRRFGLALPPAYPLHAPTEALESHLAGVLLAAIRPRASVAHAAVEIVVRPLGGMSGWALGRRWRARATALKLALEQRQEYALAPDIGAIEAKLADAAFEATISATAIAGSATDAAAAIAAVGDALGAFQQRTASKLQRLRPVGALHLEPIRTPALSRQHSYRAPWTAPPPTLLLPLRLWRGPETLSAGELGYLWQLPTGAPGALMRRDSCRRVPAPPHAYCGADPDRLILGHATRADGQWAPVGPTLRDLRQILHLTAGMGAGKSRLLANLCRQLIPQGFMLIDGKGDDRGGSLVDIVRTLLPLEAEARLVLLDPLDIDWPIGMNPLAAIAPEDARSRPHTDLALGQLLATFARIDPDTWGRSPGMQQFARMAALLALEGERHPTLAHVKQALLDAEYRDQLLQSTTNIEVISFWRDIFPRLGEGQRASCDALLRRFDALLTTETTRYLVTQAAPTFDLARAMTERMIVLAPLPDVTLGGLAGAVGTLLLQGFVRAGFNRGGSEQTRQEYPLIVDELQVLIGSGDTADMATAITRLRSLGIPTIYAHQALAQLGDLRDLMLINAGNRVLLQTQEPDAGVYARMYEVHGVSAADISGQAPTEHQYAALRCRGVAAGPFSLRPLPWPTPEEPPLPPYTGQSWQTILPEDADPADELLARLVYATSDIHRAATELARLDNNDWRRLLERWQAISQRQRAYISANPGCISDRMERQRWLSRLLAARPRVIAAAEYLRGRIEYRIRKP